MIQEEGAGARLGHQQKNIGIAVRDSESHCRITTNVYAEFLLCWFLRASSQSPFYSHMDTKSTKERESKRSTESTFILE